MVCLVTGSSRGLGRALALAFGRRGHQVIIHYKDKNREAEDIASQIKGAAFKADVRNSAEVASLVDVVIQQYGSIDVLVNNAGITKESLLIKTSEKDLDEVMDTNLKGPFNFIRAVVPYMMQERPNEDKVQRAKSGELSAKHIINISSFAGLKGKAGLAAYSASKAGLIGLTVSAACELSTYNIMVNAVMPGYMLTDMGLDSSEEAKALALNESLVKGFSSPDSVAEIICSLIETSGITGQVLNLDSRVL